jgi:ATP-dependent helicase/nuclease subunit B
MRSYGKESANSQSNLFKAAGFLRPDPEIHLLKNSTGGFDVKITAVAGELNGHHRIIGEVGAAMAQKDFSLVVVFPTLSLLREIEAELLDRPEVEGVGGVRFLLFEGFISEIAAGFGLNLRKPSSLQRELLIATAFSLLDRSGRLSYLNRIPLTSSYRRAFLDGIAEWKRSGLTPDLMISWAAEQGEKERQLALLYYTYQHLLTENSFGEADQLLEDIKELRGKTGPVEVKNRVLLYGYTDLTPQQSDFINLLSLWFEFEALVDPTTVPRFQQFIQKDFHFRGAPELAGRGPQNALFRLQQGLWSAEAVATALAPEDRSLALIRADGWARQATAIAREIRKLLNSGSGYRIEDFVIFSPKPQTFIKTAQKIFADYRLTLPEPPRAIREFAAVNYFSSCAVAVIEGWQWPRMEGLIRHFYRGSGAEHDRLIAAIGAEFSALSGRERWLELPVNPAFIKMAAELAVSPEPLRRGVETLAAIPLQTDWRGFFEWAKSWFEQEKIRYLQGITAENELLKENLDNYNALCQLKQACDEILQNSDLWEEMNAEAGLEEFLNGFTDYFLRDEVSFARSFSNEVRVISPREARGIHSKIVFLTGLEQGVFPRSYINDWKLTPQKRWELKSLGAELETGDQYQLQEEMAFYWAIRAATEQLFLVGQVQDDSGQPLNSSPFLEEVVQWFPGLTESSQYYPLEPLVRHNFADCYSRAEQRQLWVDYLTRPREEVPEAERRIGDYLFQTREYRQLAVKAFQWRNRRRIQPDQPFFVKPATGTNLAARFGPDHRFSITALEDYQKCPYRFFMKYLLQIRTVAEPELLPEKIDFGNLYHQILREFYEDDSNRRLSPERRYEYLESLEKIFSRNFQSWQARSANDLVAAVLSIEARRIREGLRRWLEAELEWTEQTGGRYVPRLLEAGFGKPEDSLPPYELEHEGCQVKLSGRIDRVDTDAAGRFMVYDYKLGKSHTTAGILEFKNIQTPVYLKVLEQLMFGPGTAVGGCYLSIAEPSRLAGGVWRQAPTGLEGKSKGLLNENDWTEWLNRVESEVAQIARSIRAGYFGLNREKCPDYCEFSGACRRREREEEPDNGEPVE